MTEQPENQDKIKVDEAKLHKICAKAVKEHTFGRSLADLTIEEKEALKPMLNNEFSKEATLLSENPIEGLTLETRKGLQMLLGPREHYSKLPSPIKHINSLQKELLIALGEYEGEVQRDNSEEGYRGEFYMYAASFKDSALGGATYERIKYFVAVGHDQITPDEDPEGIGMITISYLKSYADNLEFVKQHINRAIVLKNERDRI